jgi:FkbH-like protein
LRDIPLVLFNRFSALLFACADLRSGALAQVCDKLNSALDRTLLSHQFAVHIDSVLAQVGLTAAADFRQFQSAKALYTIDMFKAYVEHVAPAFFAATGRMRKVLVLDCDNTLWGGILGEDGDDIRMNSATRSGRVFREVQQILRGFRNNGILLALCSKNNPMDVAQVLAGHPDMVLRENDFVAKRINWEDKATNLRQLSSELNLGLDSFVFVDDSSFELGLVQEELPQVACVRVPETLSDYPAVIRRLKQDFFVLSRTSEDLRKTEMYMQEQARGETKARYGSLDEYLKSLGLQVSVAWNDVASVSRAAQLSQKTNQFNLTTRRYTEADMLRMVADQSVAIGTFAVSDRYGDYGVTGLAILRFEAEDEVAVVDSLLMSCRVIPGLFGWQASGERGKEAIGRIFQDRQERPSVWFLRFGRL